MGFGRDGSSRKKVFKTATRRYVTGACVVIQLRRELPRKYDEPVMGAGSEKGLWLTGTVVDVLGAAADAKLPAVGTEVDILARPGDGRRAIFDDLDKTNEGFRFLLEGVVQNGDTLEARWVHGAGDNRRIQPLEVVGVPHVSFENPYREDGPKNGWLHLNLDGSATEFDVRDSNGTYAKHEFMFDDVVGRLQTALERNLKFRVSQRVLAPSKAMLVYDDGELAAALTSFRIDGFTSCVVRSFIPGTKDSKQVDVQLLSWPADVPVDGNFKGLTYEMPTLQPTKRFVELQDGEAHACMEVIPGYVASLVGNADTEKSTKHKFVRNIVKGLSDGQKSMYGTQGYGPGVSISAVNDGEVSGLTRLAIRTDGVQYRNLMTIPTPNFMDADKIQSGPAKMRDAVAEPAEVS